MEPTQDQLLNAAIMLDVEHPEVAAMLQGMTEKPQAVEPACSAEEFELRGVLARKLQCWHRLSEAEAANLIEFVRSLERQASLPSGWEVRAAEDGICLTSPNRDRWRFRETDSIDLFVFRFLSAILDAAPAQPKSVKPYCNRDLADQGKHYPRTCQQCGLGPCTERKS